MEIKEDLKMNKNIQCEGGYRQHRYTHSSVYICVYTIHRFHICIHIEGYMDSPQQLFLAVCRQMLNCVPFILAPEPGCCACSSLRARKCLQLTSVKSLGYLGEYYEDVEECLQII